MSLRGSAWLRSVLLVAAGLAAMACPRRPDKHFVESVETSGLVSTTGHSLLEADELKSMLMGRLQRHGGFRVRTGDEPPPDKGTVTRLGLWVELGMGESSDREEVRALLELRPRSVEGARFELSARRPLAAGREEGELRAAVEAAMGEALDRSHWLLTAWSKPDLELLRDLHSGQASRVEAAVDVLAFRKNPAAADALLARLASPDVFEVRRAIGGLIELREQRAVPPLIELARAKDLMFIREIVFALGAIGGEEAEAYLFTIAQGHDSPAIREAAEQAMRELSGGPAPFEGRPEKGTP